jgi:phosphatidylserine/phosphatidylglycerophosphate/cardiolipin synthase-like enzyme
MIQNLTKSLFDLLPELTGGLGNSLLHDDPDRPETRWLRPVQVSTGIQSTYVVPGDWPDKPDAWFADDAPTYPLRKQNNVEYFIDGEATFEAMVEAIETATGPDHFIVLLGWACHLDFVMSKSGRRCPGAKRTFLDVVKERVDMGVTVRVLLYYNWLGDTEFTGKSAEMTTKSQLDEIERIKPRSPAKAKIRCILDDGVKEVKNLLNDTLAGTARASHHQKVLLVCGSEGLVGFFGGVDVNGDRVNPSTLRMFAGPELHDVHGPLHDVHARVRGEAADDLMVLARNRWNFSVPSSLVAEAEDDGKGGFDAVRYATGKDMDDISFLLDRARAQRVAPAGPHHVLKIAQTVGNPKLAKLQDNGAWPMVRHAIQQAKKFIYMEDQYLWSVDAAEEIGKAVGNLSHVTILLPPDDQMPNARLRYRALKRLKEVAGAGAEKIRIYLIREPVHQYIHAKMWIFDDEYVLLGSPNCNNRGYFTDSEVNGGIADPEWGSDVGPRAGKWWALEANLPHKLRMELWAEHLRMPTDALVDGLAAEVHWRFPPANARIKPYTIAAGGGAGSFLWHEFPYDDYDGSVDSVQFAIADPKI